MELTQKHSVDTPREETSALPPFAVTKPKAQTLPLVLASPHSGSDYPASFLQASRLDHHNIRQSEDFYVHDLFASASRLGAPLIHATFPRAYIDVNREPYELDPDMFDGPLPSHANGSSPCVAAGLGTIARIVASGAPIYSKRLSVAEAERRITMFYHPYHAALKKLITDTVTRFGYCLLVDCHSMPSSAVSGNPGTVGFVLGDGHGTTCDRSFVDTAHRTLATSEWKITRNAPYAGGYTTRHYSQPGSGAHTLQIEINRSLYMDEITYARKEEFREIADLMERLVLALGNNVPARATSSR